MAETIPIGPLRDNQHSMNDRYRLEWAKQLLSSLTGKRFFGSVTLKFEDGTIVHARKEENLKPP